jgi:nucleoside phosphorylase
MRAAAKPGPSEADVAILTALPVEHRAVRRVLDRVASAVDGPVRRADGYVAQVGPYRVVAICLAAMGNPSAAAGAQKVIDQWQPACIILCGIAGGAQDTAALGDVLVADTVVGYEPGRSGADGLRRRPDVHRPAFPLLAAAKAIDPGDWVSAVSLPRPDGVSASPTVHFGTVLSGEKVIADAETLVELTRTWPNTIGVEMEGLGVATAAYRAGSRFLLVKGVSDQADWNKDDAWQEYASETAACFVHSLLASAPFSASVPAPDATGEAGPREIRLFELAAPHRSPCRIGVIAGSIKRVRSVDMWVSSENTDMEMSRITEFTISGIIRYWGAGRDDAGRVVDDVIARELTAQVNGRAPVAAGSAFVTGSGSLQDSHRVRHIVHVASVQGEPGAGFRQVSDVGLCVTNALVAAERVAAGDPQARTILFPLLGVGSGGGLVGPTADRMINAFVDHLVEWPQTHLQAIYLLGYSGSQLSVVTEHLTGNARLLPVSS